MLALPTYSYRSALETSERIQWKVSDLLNDERRLDFTKPFLPESLARTEELSFFLNADERRVFNQIRANTYLAMFGIVEEFIVPFLLDHVRPLLHGDDYRMRAILQFADEEAKHIQLFRRFAEAFREGFGTHCDVIGPPADIAQAVLSHHPLGVALAILQIEWMTQRHYIESVKDSRDLDPCFKSLLKHHWLEEAQHAKIDTLVVNAIAENLTPEQIARGIDDYVAIGGIVDGGLQQQIQFDLDAFERATGRFLTSSERELCMKSQLQANRYTYLGSGMTHPSFLQTLGNLNRDALLRVAELAPAFS